MNPADVLFAKSECTRWVSPTEKAVRLRELVNEVHGLAAYLDKVGWSVRISGAYFCSSHGHPEVKITRTQEL